MWNKIKDAAFITIMFVGMIAIPVVGLLAAMSVVNLWPM